MSEQLKKFTCKWNGNEWFWLDENPFRALSLEIKMVRAEDADALAERLAECEAALKFYANEKSWTTAVDYDGYCVNGVIGSVDTEQLNEASFEHGGKTAREYFAKWGSK